MPIFIFNSINLTFSFSEATRAVRKTPINNAIGSQKIHSLKLKGEVRKLTRGTFLKHKDVAGGTNNAEQWNLPDEAGVEVGDGEVARVLLGGLGGDLDQPAP